MFCVRTGTNRIEPPAAHATRQLAQEGPTLMGRLVVMWLLGMALQAAPSAAATLNRFEFTQTEMAVPIRIVLYAADDATAAEAARGRVFPVPPAERHAQRLRPAKRTAPPLRHLLRGEGGPRQRRSVAGAGPRRRAFRAVGGAFDVTVGPVVRLWRNARRHEGTSLARSRSRRPCRGSAIASFVSTRTAGGGTAAAEDAVGPRRNRQGIRGRRGDGGAAQARNHADDGRGGRQHRPGRSSARASRAGGSASPRPTLDSPPRQYLWLSRVAISTSGDLWQYAVIGGVRYSHLIDPRTGMALDRSQQRDRGRPRRLEHRRSLVGRGDPRARKGTEAHREHARRGGVYRPHGRWKGADVPIRTWKELGDRTEFASLIR